MTLIAKGAHKPVEGAMVPTAQDVFLCKVKWGWERRLGGIATLKAGKPQCGALTLESKVVSSELYLSTFFFKSANLKFAPSNSFSIISPTNNTPQLLARAVCRKQCCCAIQFVSLTHSFHLP
jgi:hypothetical protein